MQQLSKHPVVETGLNTDDSCLKNNIDSMKVTGKFGGEICHLNFECGKKKRTAGSSSSAEERVDSLSWAGWDELQKRHSGLTVFRKKFSERFGDHPTCYMGNYNSTLADREKLK